MARTGYSFEGGMSDLIILVPHYCLSFYFALIIYFCMVTHKAAYQVLSKAFWKCMIGFLG